MKISNPVKISSLSMPCKSNSHKNYKAHFVGGIFQSYVCLDCGEFFDFVR
ncbi:hypothetical protein VPHK460_0260 [Vibrio phage K460]